MRLSPALPALFILVTALPAVSQQVWDGTWSGTSSQGRTVSFDVASNRITKFVYGGVITGSCSATFDSTLTPSNGYTVNANGSFTISAPSSAPGSSGVTANGSFTTAGTGSGSYNYNLNSIPGVPSCSGSGTATFTVSRLGGPPPLTPVFSVAGIVAVVGSLPGNGTYFKTALQIHNPRSTPISGKLVFHTRNVNGSASDPSISYTLNGGQTIDYADLLPAMGIASGIGSLDVMTTGDPVPIMAARIFSDNGEKGTAGFFLDPLAPGAALQAGESGVLVAPIDVAKARLNIGVRSLEAGAAFQITVRDKAGAVRFTTTKSYTPNFFEQVDGAGYVGITLNASDTITFSMNSGKAIIYGAQTENTSQDPSVAYAKKTF